MFTLEGIIEFLINMLNACYILLSSQFFLNVKKYINVVTETWVISNMLSMLNFMF